MPYELKIIRKSDDVSEIIRNFAAHKKAQAYIVCCLPCGREGLLLLSKQHRCTGLRLGSTIHYMNIIKKAFTYFWLHIWKYKAVERQHKKLVEQLKNEHRPVNVVFMALDVSLWRYQHVYELMANDERFRVCVVISPCPLREDPDKDAEGLRLFFKEKGVNYIDYIHGEPAYDIRNELKPDIIFYTQPYEYLLQKEHDCLSFYDRLICYLPYAFNSFKKWSYNLHFCNQAWRLYYTDKYALTDAMTTTSNNGRNVRIVGYANADEYLRDNHLDVWKDIKDGKNRKRIIWAPHFTINENNSAIPPRSNFLWMAELMITIAKEYEDTLQIAFKPHPALLTQLYKNAEWGKEKADNYYDMWNKMPNTQLEEGQYIDLFMTSDAMIHDSASFSVEYHFSQKPVMFVLNKNTQDVSSLNIIGRKAMDLHYKGAAESDIRTFINDVVLNSNDSLFPQREHFYQEYLLPPNGKSVSQNVVDDIVTSLNL